MKSSRIRMLFYAGMLLPFCFALLAQEAVKTSSIVLAIKDQSGAIVPNAHVEIVPSPNNIGKNLTTDSDGKLSLDVSPGSYEVTVESPGFLTIKRRIEAKTGMHQTIDIVLKVQSCPPGPCPIVTNIFPVSFPAQSQALSPDKRVERIINGLLPAATVKGQPVPRMTLAERMKYYNTPEVSIAFFRDGRVDWARGYGLADQTTNKPLTPDTLFQAASISKSVTAFAALRLVQQGELSLDEDVNLKLVSWKVPDNEFTKSEKVTLKRLLSHTAGMTVPSVGGYQAGEYLPTTVQVLKGEKTSNEPVRVDRVPGKEFRYSGGGLRSRTTIDDGCYGQAFSRAHAQPRV